ncbi:MAG: DUF4159 domain-containing protein [Bacteroidetes bacterium]|nr:DUF4159 domain-containing protein [Bacteroidota bacterium]
MTLAQKLASISRYGFIGIAVSGLLHLAIGTVILMTGGEKGERIVSVELHTYDVIKPPIKFEAQPPRFVKTFDLAKDVDYSPQTTARQIVFSRAEAPVSTAPVNNTASAPSASKGGGEGSVFFGALTASTGATDMGWGVPGGATSYGRSFGVGGSGGFGAGPGDGKDWGPNFAGDVENTRSSGGGGLAAMRDNLISSENFEDRFDGFIEINPKNKKDIRGFLNIYQLEYNSTKLERSPAPGWDIVDGQPSWNCVPQALPSLAKFANDSTKLRVNILGTIRLDSKELNTVPFLYMMGFQAGVRYTKEEALNIGRYLRSGGFIFIDDGNAYQPGAFNITVRQMLRDALGYDAVFEKVPNSHPMYTVWETFSGPPSGDDMMRYRKEVREVKEIYPYVEAIFLNGRMVALVSNRGYNFAWGYWKILPASLNGPLDNTRQIQFGLNVIVYALSQRGGIVDQNRTKIAAEQKR